MVDISCIHSQHSHTDQRKGLPFLSTSLLGEGDLTIFLRSETFGPWHGCAQVRSTFTQDVMTQDFLCSPQHPLMAEEKQGT